VDYSSLPEIEELCDADPATLNDDAWAR